MIQSQSNVNLIVIKVYSYFNYQFRLNLYQIFFIPDNLKVLSMGNTNGCLCISAKHKQQKEGLQPLCSIPLHEKQTQLLHLMYANLAERIPDYALNLQNFLLFFHKNGLWGQRLFKEFDYNQNNLLDQKEFIDGIAKISKTQQDKKIQLLFKFFAHSYKKEVKDSQTSTKQIQSAKELSHQQQGVCFETFLLMLYNYPKEDLKKVLNDKQFFEAELRGSLKTIGENRRLQSVYKMGTYIKNKKPLAVEFQEKMSNMQNNAGGTDYNQPSMVGRNILNHIKGAKNDVTTFQVQDGQNVVQIKTNDFNHLVKKFAIRMFQSMKINRKTQTLCKTKFCNWIKKHRILYTTYYSGFHNYIWQFDQVSNNPMYLVTENEKRSQARYLLNVEPKRLKKVEIILINSILVVVDEKDQTRPIDIICLDGLQVARKHDVTYGYGLDITHRDAIFVSRALYFKNQLIRQEWAEMLKYFKGQNISTMFDMKEKIGAGKFSVVYEGKQLQKGKQTGNKYAIKVIQFYKLDNDAKEMIAHETSIMQILSHPLLVKFKSSIQTKTHLYIIAQLCPGKDLFQFVKDFRYLQQYDAAIIIQQMIVGLRYMHSLGIVHRDLKPENIMVNYENGQIQRIKIIDFGFSNYIEILQELPPEELLAGTPNYMAPQLLRRQPITVKIDIFALGAILFFMLSGALPFNDFSLTEIFNRTLDGTYNFKQKIWEKVSDEAKDLINQFLKNNPDERITLEQALKHPWFKCAQEKTKKRTGVSIPHRKNMVQLF